ncbi:MAG: SUMF1/EgtB/PvdO family nonheme iron enzyme [Kiritimatiellaeota bacterium]|nr:SUMF1/EgtB/PvdO family nonheme iron enzyme [Kiritimatiellota bacterium]
MTTIPMLGNPPPRFFQGLEKATPTFSKAWKATLAALLLAATARAAAPTPEQTTALRLAIEDLTKTFPEKYTRGAEFLKQLDSVTNEAAFAALQREALLANPLLDFEKLLLVRRGEAHAKTTDAKPKKKARGQLGLPANWQGNSSLPRQGYDDEIAVLSPVRPDGKLTTLYQPERDVFVGDLNLNWDGQRLLFSSIASNNTWQVFEIGTDGKNLRQVTPDADKDVDNYNACYLPDGALLFSSTATFLGVPCVFGSSYIANLYRLETNASIRQVTFEQEHDWHPFVTPDGRVLYARWEYTDASHSNSRMLFQMNPDGTDQRSYRGSGSWFPGSLFYAKPVPGHPGRVVGIASGHHGVARLGRLIIFETPEGRADGNGIAQEIPGRGKTVEPIVRDQLIHGYPEFLMPWPLNDKYFLVSCKPDAVAPWGIYLVDVFDNMTLIKELAGEALFEPIPLRTTERPPVIPSRVDLTKSEATVHIHDLYEGPGLAGVPRGTVKALRIVGYEFSRRGNGGLYGTIGSDGPWDMRRVIGTVPVKPDGSVKFQMPANTPLMFQPLDEKGQALQLMRTWVTAMPGETVSCAGCHEDPGVAPMRRASKASQAAPAKIKPWYGPGRGFSCVREVRPVLNKYCIGCHNENHALDFSGNKPLTGWSTQMAGNWRSGGQFTLAYWQLQRYVRRPGIESDRGLFTPLEFHFSTTELGQLLRKGHHGVQLNAESFNRLVTWADENAPFHGRWSDVPGINTNNLCAMNQRLLESRRKYAPMGTFDDPEVMPETPKFDATTVKPAQISNHESQIPRLAGWPFSVEEATRLQKQTVPGGGAPLQLIPLVKPTSAPPPPVKAKFVRVWAGPAKWLQIAEAEIFSAGRNVALGRPAKQSSTYGGGWEAQNAVDGKRAGQATHTRNGDHEWWEVELADECLIDKLEFWPRPGVCVARLAEAKVELLDAKRNVVWERVTPNTIGEKVTFNIGTPANNSDLAVAWIPAGEFLMGSAEGHADERPVHRQKIAKGFWMTRCEITNEQFKQFDPQHESGNEDRHGYQFGITGYPLDAANQPVVRVSLDEAQAYCRWLSQKLGKRVTLPTEAQWEWACRAGSATPFWYGGLDTDFSKSANLGDAMLANFSGNPYQQDWKTAAHKNPNKFDNWIPQDARFNDGGFVTEPVGKYAPNPWGLCDIHGNAAEWTLSTYLPYPKHSEAEGEKVVRGGSWYDRPFHGTSSYRLPFPSWQKIHNVGFRVIIEDNP